MDVIIVCHTEFGFVKDRAIIFDKKAVRQLAEGVFNLEKLSKKYGAKITYCACPETADYFPKEIRREIGLHIHPGWEEFGNKKSKWMVGDAYLKESFDFGKKSTALKDYTYSEQLEMIKKGRDFLESRLGVEPRVFLAGRWSENADTARALSELGFTHDCSALPGLKTSYADWSSLPRICMPYKPAPSLLLLPASRGLLKATASPEDAGRYGISWLKACFTEYYKQNMPLFHIALHSPAMTDSFYINAMDSLLAFISSRKNINFKFASEIEEYPKTKAKADILPYLLAVNGSLAKAIFKRALDPF